MKRTVKQSLLGELRSAMPLHPDIVQAQRDRIIILFEDAKMVQREISRVTGIHVFNV